MRLVWSFLRLVWGTIGTVIVGLLITGLYSLMSRQPLPDLQLVDRFLLAHKYWLGGGLVLLTFLSLIAHQAHRVERSGTPRPQQIERSTLRDRIKAIFKHKAQPLTTNPPKAPMVGRDGDLAKLHGWFVEVQAGKRRIVFVSGEPGIGKTTLVGAFLDSLASDGAVRVGRGQCVEQYGAGEPYMPLLDALTRLGREANGKKIVETLHRIAPAWLAQMPSLIEAEDRARLQGQAPGVTQARMLREMAEALAAIASETPLVLLFEDLHWSDFSTLELIATLARRTEPAKLMILGTYRPVEMLAGDHPLRKMKAELELHHQCEELPLKLLSVADVGTYLGERFANRRAGEILRSADSAQNDLKGGLAEEEAPAAVPSNSMSFRSEQGDGRAQRGIPKTSQIASAIYARSDGNPLFMVNIVDYLEQQGSFDTNTIDAPHNIKQMIERNLERLSEDDQRVLEAASVTGAEFSAAAVAAALERPTAEIEACCTRLSRQQQFINRQGSAAWPDGTIASNFRFHHALYQDVLYDRLPDGHRVEFHRRIAQREETAYGDRAGEIAAELANHYRSANEKSKAIVYLRIAAERSKASRAFVEAEGHYRDAIALLMTLPESRERDGSELDLQVELGDVMVATRGWSATETSNAFARARSLADRNDDHAKYFEVFNGLRSAAVTQGKLRQALAMDAEALQLARAIGTPMALLVAHQAQGNTYYYLGEFLPAREHMRAGVEIYNGSGANRMPSNNIGGSTMVWYGLNDWFLGYPDSGLRMVQAALTRAREDNDYFSVSVALSIGSHILCRRGEYQQVLNATAEAQQVSGKSGFRLTNSISVILSAWARAHLSGAEGAADEIRKVIAGFDASNFHLGRSLYLCLLAEVEMIEGALDQSALDLEKALNSNPEELFFRPETHRLLGNVLQLQGRADEAERHYREAITLAQKMSAKSWELRATTSLARLLASQGRREEARTRLEAIYGWFTEGFDTLDLKEAKALLDDLT